MGSDRSGCWRTDCQYDSPNPTMSLRDKSFLRVSVEIPRAALLIEAINGAVENILMGWSFKESRKSTTPSYPDTGKGSMVSVIMVVVPPFIAYFKNSYAVYSEARWVCPSIKPGITVFPPASITSVSAPIECSRSLPTEAIHLPFMLIEELSRISPV